jgi:hypothetical protein
MPEGPAPITIREANLANESSWVVWSLVRGEIHTIGLHESIRQVVQMVIEDMR